DVLDTWFSSGLWPLSTLGWPNKKRMTEKGFDRFFPTSVLVTGFDIIFFWVARMMMMSLKSAREIPFEKVYIHAIVRDKLGRKMSKSLGNGIDPLEMVKLYGADAFRFTLAAGSGYNRTLNLDPARIEGYRNFINKIWNAFRFIHPYIHAHKTSSLNKDDLDHHERWILSELAVATDKINKSLEDFRFDDASSTIYSFTYDKFCSWFIEISKKILHGEENSTRKRRINVLKFCFKQMIKLLHPITPFITEELWSYLKEKEDEPLIIQSYPVFDKKMVFTSDQEQMDRFIEIITNIRHLRAKLDIKPKDEIQVRLFSDDPELLDYFMKNQGFFFSLARVKEISTHSKKDRRPSKAVMSATGHTEIHLLLEGVIDFAAQTKRLQKQLDKIKKESEKLRKKLSNPMFIKNAPGNIVEKEKEKVSLCQEKMESINSILKQLTT
ncbi:MAG: class I tRNA ligase family protein, partial [Halobacteriovoraceae bacterium]|nr:class I tRNA ligase family protein [Halobacteriovoraceae bacterium]